MSHEAVKDHLRGVAAGLLSPFGDEGDLDHDALAENARTLAGEGLRTFLAPANISEYHSLGHDERVAFAETAVEALPADAAVFAGVGGSTRAATDLIGAYDEVGADAMMVMPPDHAFVHERGLLRYYETLAAATDTPLVPYAKGHDHSVEFLAALTRVDGVAGIKYAIEDAHLLAEATAAGADDVVWADGLAEPYAPEFYLAGAEGFSAGVSNFEPAVGLALFDALEAGDYERAAELRDVTLPYMNFRATTGEDNVIPSGNSVPAVKKGLELAGLHGGQVREPLVELSAADERRAEELYDELREEMDRLLG